MSIKRLMTEKSESPFPLPTPKSGFHLLLRLERFSVILSPQLAEDTQNRESRLWWQEMGKPERLGINQSLGRKKIVER